jgi:hypothetical protein
MSRRNDVYNPGPRTSSLTGWSHQAGTGEVTTASWVSTPGDGPEGRTGYLRRTVTTAKTAGTSGSFYRSAVGEVVGSAGDVRTLSIWVRFRQALTAQVSGQLRTGASASTTGVGALISVPANTWTRLSVKLTASAGYDGVQVWAVVSGGTIPVAGVYESGDVLAELSAEVLPYFDGSMSANTAWLYSWAGLPNASASIATSTMQLALVGTGTPQDVQVVIPGLTAGQVYLVEGTAVGSVWPVRGGRGTSNGSQLVLSDSRAPINVPVVYRVTVGGVMVRQSEPITVPHPEKYVLQSLDGQTTADVELMASGLPREPEPRVSSYSIPGRPRPVVRYDVPGEGGGSLLVDTTGEQTPALAALLATGRPVVVRTDGAVRDFPAVEILLITGFPSQLTDALIQAGDTRRWTLEYLLIDDPDPDAVLPSSTWDDFDAVNAGFTWDDFDLQWVGADWDAFDRFDWEGQA